MVTRRSWHLFGARNQARSGSSGSSPAAVTVGELSPVEFIARLDQLVAVYAAAMRPAPELLAGRRTIMDARDATQLLENAGFQVKINRFGFSNKVWDYSPVGQAPPGSVITLEVGPF